LPCREKKATVKVIDNQYQDCFMQADSISYFRLKFSLLHFGRSAHELTAQQRLLVDEKAQSEQRLHQLILGQPEAAQVVVDDEATEQARQVIIERYPSRDEFVQDLEKNDLDEDEYNFSLRNELIVGAVLELVGRRAEAISEDEAREYYQENRSKFRQPEQRTVRQILITVDEDGPEENKRQTSYRRLASIRERLLNDVSTFGVEAATHSECPSALNKGLLGTLPQGKLYPQFDEALSLLPINQVSDIIETELGFHLLLCEAIEPARILSWAEVGPRIREHLQGEREKRQVVDWLKELEKGSMLSD